MAAWPWGNSGQPFYNREERLGRAMCLATPGVILAITAVQPGGDPADPLWRSAEVDFGGVRQQVSLACLPEAEVGDRVLVHVGVALSLVEEDA
jgi:hydrogenase expression/formation protein HypC